MIRILVKITLLVLIFCQGAFSQITSVQQVALNSYVEYGNQSAKEISIVVENLRNYYESVNENRSWSGPRFSCPVQPDTYYFENAIKLGKAVSAPGVISKLQSLKILADSIDFRCKQLDTYYKLEDYKQDNHAGGLKILGEFPGLLKQYRKAQDLLQSDLEILFQRLNKSQSAYSKADQLMRKCIAFEKSRLDWWHLNFEEKIHAGWPDQEIYQSIPESDNLLKELNQAGVNLKYPASSMWSSFKESLATLIVEKRRAIDEYNFEAKKSDKHSNDVYLNLINYYNGLLVSNYNTFIDFTKRDGYLGVKYIQYFPSFDIRTQAKNLSIDAQPFSDQPDRELPALGPQGEISKPIFGALSNYVAFINETWRQVRYMQSALTSFNSSASYYKSLSSYAGRGPMHFDFQEFNIPISYYQKAIQESRLLPSSVSDVLNSQADALLSILNEMNYHAAQIDISVKARDYEKDNLNQIYAHLERQSELIKIWDNRKEKLFNNIETVYQSYLFDTKSPWFISGTALHQLVHFDRDALFLAKAYYSGDTTQKVNTADIDASVRDVLAREYQNMNGIQKFGRNNGLCPYTPYEDIPAASRRLSELLKKIKQPSSASRHPYEGMLYDYNEVVDLYNDFCALSKDVLLLQHIFQPEMFSVIYPHEEREKQPGNRSGQPKMNPETRPTVAKENAARKPLRDTVYIVQHDTVYKTLPVDENYSMDGYATNNMVLLLDVSGSMNTPEKLPLLKETLLSLLGIMREEDQISVIAFSKKANVLLKPVSFKNEQKIRQAIEKLESSGKTDANAGLKAAYKIADGSYIRGGNNRIILATDGEFPVSEATLKLVKGWAEQDIFLTIFNFGKNTSAKVLENLALLGHGNYEYISTENARLKLIREAKSKKRK